MHVAVAATLVQLPTAAGSGHCKGYTSSRYGVHKCSFPCTCDTNKQPLSMHTILNVCPVKFIWGYLPCVTTLPNTGRLSSVEQFQRRLRNWNWHSSMASWAPLRTASITSTLRLQIWTCLWMSPLSFSQVSSSEMLPTDDSFARYLRTNQESWSINVHIIQAFVKKKRSHFILNSRY